MRGRRVVCSDGKIYTILSTIVDFSGHYAIWVVRSSEETKVIDSRRCILLG